MKYLKSFEKLKKEPKVGDYILLNVSYPDPDFIEYLNSHIGVIKSIKETDDGVPYYIIEYDDVPSHFNADSYNHYKGYTHAFDHNKWGAFKYNVTAYSKNKKDLIPLIQMNVSSNKFNL